MSDSYRGFSKEALEREYSPSSCIPDIQPFLDRYSTLSREVREALSATSQCKLGLRYGTQPGQTLDLFIPSAEHDNKPPLHVFIHGGYWQQLDKSDSSFGALSFVQAGVAYCAINYTLAPTANLDEIVGEVRSAIAWLYSHAAELGFSEEQIYLSGSSAGAHLAAMAMGTRWQDYAVPSDVIKGVCAVSGIYDIEPIRQTYINEPLDLTEQQVLGNSPLFHTADHPCPVLIAYGANETQEFKRQSIDYAAVLESRGVDVSVHEIADKNHFDVILELADPDSVLWALTFELITLARAPGASRASR